MYYAELSTDELLTPGMSIHSSKTQREIGHIVDACQTEPGTYKVLVIMDESAIVEHHVVIAERSPTAIGYFSLPYSW